MQKGFTVLLSVIVICFSSCYQNIRFANRAVSPGFTHQGEGKFLLAVKPNGNEGMTDTLGVNRVVTSPISTELNAAYAITDHIAVIAAYSSVMNRSIPENISRSIFNDRDTTIGGRINQHLGEIGGGLFTRLGGKGKCGAYLVLGMGTIKRTGIVLPQHNYNTQFFRYSFQPEIGAQPSRSGSKKFSFTAGTRLTGIKYSGFQAANPDTKYALGDYRVNGQQDVTNQLYFYVDPYVNLEFGYKYVKLNIQFGATFGTFEEARYIGQTPYISGGLLFHYDPEY